MWWIKTGTASGPFTDSPKLFWAIALTPSQHSEPNKEITYPNLPIAHSFINILHNAKLPDDVLPAFNASYFCALHKKIGLWPILIGTSLKQISGTIELNAFASDLLLILAPHQYGIALPEGMTVPYNGYLESHSWPASRSFRHNKWFSHAAFLWNHKHV
jgi:hypothetical protein